LDMFAYRGDSHNILDEETTPEKQWKNILVYSEVTILAYSGENNILAYICLYNLEIWSRGEKIGHGTMIVEAEIAADAVHRGDDETQAAHGDQGGGDEVDVPATRPPTRGDSLPQVLQSWQVPKFNVFMEQPTNTAMFIDMNDDLGKGGDNKLIHAVVADDHGDDGEGFGGDDEQTSHYVRTLYTRKICLEDTDVSGKRLPRPPTAKLTPRRRSTTQHEQFGQMPRFEETVHESANNCQ
jgi:hypothetical protein